MIGGCCRGTPTKTTAVLDLGTMVFAPGPAMAAAREGCAAVVPPGGSCALVVGGCDDENSLSTSSTELFNLGTMTFEPGPQMLSPRGGCAAVVLDARRILIIGGNSDSISFGYDGTNLATTEVLDIGTMAFAPGPSMQTRRWGCAAVLLPGERCVLVIGGYDGTTHHATTEILDIDTMSFSPGPVMSQPRSWCAVVSLPGSILVVGGIGDAAAKTTEALSLQTMTFAAGPMLLTTRNYCTALALSQDYSPLRALVVGGHHSTTDMLTAAG